MSMSASRATRLIKPRRAQGATRGAPTSLWGRVRHYWDKIGWAHVFPPEAMRRATGSIVTLRPRRLRLPGRLDSGDLDGDAVDGVGGVEETGVSEIRQMVRRRLQSGDLPDHVPPAALLQPGERMPIGMEAGGGRRCSACGGEQADLMYRYPDREVAFHDTCQRIWAEERDRER
jgi:hypothetical protein